MTGVDVKSARWWVGLVVAVGAAVMGYLAGGCTRAELSRAQDALALRGALCAYVNSSNDTRLTDFRQACARGDEVEQLLQTIMCEATPENVQ